MNPARLGVLLLLGAALLFVIGATAWAVQKAGPPTREPPTTWGERNAP